MVQSNLVNHCLEGIETEKKRTSSTVRVEDGLLLALDRFGVVQDGVAVQLGRVELVAASLELEGELRSGLRKGEI